MAKSSTRACRRAASGAVCTATIMASVASRCVGTVTAPQSKLAPRHAGGAPPRNAPTPAPAARRRGSAPAPPRSRGRGRVAPAPSPGSHAAVGTGRPAAPPAVVVWSPGHRRWRTNGCRPRREPPSDGCRSRPAGRSAPRRRCPTRGPAPPPDRSPEVPRARSARPHATDRTRPGNRFTPCGRAAGGDPSRYVGLVEFRLLGPLGVWTADGPVDAGQPRQRRVLAALLVDAGRPVTPDTLVDRVWGADRPDGARHTLHTYIARIRRVLARRRVRARPARLVHRSGGYLLEVDPDRVDLHRFRRLVALAGEPAAARRPTGPTCCARRWRCGAASRWPACPAPGPAASGRPAAASASDAVRAVGRAPSCGWATRRAVIEPLTALVDEHPLAEPVVAALMRALHAAGRAAGGAGPVRRAADAAGRRARHRAGRRSCDALCTGRSCAARPSAPVAAAPATLGAGWPGRQRPPAWPAFAGRGAAAAPAWTACSTAGGGPAAGAVVIVALSGTAGVGKTALAVHWAHRVAGRFPDGQLYVNLRGFDPPAPVISPPTRSAASWTRSACRRSASRPASDAQAALYRSLLAGRRVLVVLDNARDAEQVRPLLPGAPGCLAVVTSRDRLTGLVAAGRRAPADRWTCSAPPRPRELLARRLGRQRVAAEPAAVADDRRPVRPAAAGADRRGRPRRAAPGLPARRRWPTSCATPAGVLDALAGGDAGHRRTRGVLLVVPARSARRRRGCSGCSACTPGPTSRARRRGQPGRARRRPGPRPALAELRRAHLLAEHLARPVRLPRPAARVRRRAGAARSTTRPSARAARRRLLDHYLHTAHAATALLDPHQDPITLARPARRGHAAPAADPAAALAWFTAEHRAGGGGRQAGRRPVASTRTRGSSAWALCELLRPARALARPGRHVQAVALAAAAARRRRHSPQAHAHRALGLAYTRLGRPDEAHRPPASRPCDRYAARRRRAPARRTPTSAWAGSWSWTATTRPCSATPQQALELYEPAGHPAGQAQALNCVGWAHAQLGDHRQALAHCEQALALHQRHGPRRGEAVTWDSLGYAHHHLGDYPAGDRPATGGRWTSCGRPATATSRRSRCATSATVSPRPGTPSGRPGPPGGAGDPGRPRPPAGGPAPGRPRHNVIHASCTLLRATSRTPGSR